MVRLSGIRKHLPKVIVLGLFAFLQVSIEADPVTIASAVAPDGANYLYDLQVTDLSSTDPYAILFNVSFSLPAGSVIGTPMAPAGYDVFADPNSGYLQFSALNISGFPVGQAVSGFEFLSATQFNSLSFSASYLDSTQTVATSFSGATTPVASPAVPEPATVGLIGLAGLLFVYRLRTRSTKVTA